MPKTLILPMFDLAANGYNLGMTMTVNMANLKVDIQPAQAEAGSGNDAAEIAAAIACVFAVLKSGAVEQNEAETGRRGSNWAFASRIEAIGEAEVKESQPQGLKNGNRSNWWIARSALLSAITALSGVFFSLA